jgi:hypothetical protein
MMKMMAIAACLCLTWAAMGGDAAAGAKKKIVFVPGSASHGYGGHAYGAASALLARLLNENVPTVEAIVLKDGWPKDISILENADAIVLGSDGGGLVNKYRDQLDALMKKDKGIGLACLHYTVDPGQPESVKKLIEWIGGAYEQNWSVNPHWEAIFTKFPDHPAARGLKPFRVDDEWYYHMRFAPEMKGVTPILTAIPPDGTRERPDGPHSNNPTVRAGKGQPEHVGWVYERPNGGRGFGFTGMHTHWTWGNNGFRKSVLNALVWIAKAEVPPNGVETKPLTVADLQADLGQTPPANFKPEGIDGLLKKWAKQEAGQ